MQVEHPTPPIAVAENLDLTPILCARSGLISKRFSRPSTTSSLMMYLPPCCWSGSLYIRSSMISSQTARSARAPVSRFRRARRSAAARRA